MSRPGENRVDEDPDDEPMIEVDTRSRRGGAPNIAVYTFFGTILGGITIGGLTVISSVAGAAMLSGTDYGYDLTEAFHVGGVGGVISGGVSGCLIGCCYSLLLACSGGEAGTGVVSAAGSGYVADVVFACWLGFVILQPGIDATFAQVSLSAFVGAITTALPLCCLVCCIMCCCVIEESGQENKAYTGVPMSQSARGRLLVQQRQIQGEGYGALPDPDQDEELGGQKQHQGFGGPRPPGGSGDNLQ